MTATASEFVLQESCDCACHTTGNRGPVLLDGEMCCSCWEAAATARAILKNRIESEWTLGDVMACEEAIDEAKAFSRDGWTLDLESDFDKWGLGRPCVSFIGEQYGEHGFVAFDPGVGEHNWYIPSWKDSPTWKTLVEIVDYVEHEDDEETEK